MLKLTILLPVESAAKRNWSLGSIVIPAMLPPAVKGEPATGLKAPLLAIEKAETVPSAPLPTYWNPVFGETAILWGFTVGGKGDPTISVKIPRTASMLKTEIEAEPWLRTKRNWPPELMHRLTGLLPTGVGGSAVPIGVSNPAWWSTVNPETVLEVILAT